MINHKLLILTLAVSFLVGISAGQNNPNPNGNPGADAINNGNDNPGNIHLAELQAALAGLRPRVYEPVYGPENLDPHERLLYDIEHYGDHLNQALPEVPAAEPDVQVQVPAAEVMPNLDIDAHEQHQMEEEGDREEEDDDNNHDDDSQDA